MLRKVKVTFTFEVDDQNVDDWGSFDRIVAGKITHALYNGEEGLIEADMGMNVEIIE